MRLLSVILLMLATPAAAQNLESMQKATNLGTIIASESACGLTLNQAGIQAWIAANVSPDDLDFASTLSMMTLGSEMQINDMSTSAKTAHCATVVMTARSEGLID
jgi:hypothetical protein